MVGNDFLKMHTGNRAPSSWREYLAVGLRRRRIISVSFLVIFLGAVLLALLLPPQYEARMKLLVGPERADSAVTPGAKTPVELRSEVSEEEMRSEGVLLKSRDLLEKVVVACRLHKPGSESFWESMLAKLGGAWGSRNPQADDRIPAAVLRLEKTLAVEPIKGTNLITVTYGSDDPRLAARVLETLANLYAEKRLALRRFPDVSRFFEQRAEEHRMALAGAQARLSEFGRKEGVASAPFEKEIAIRKLAEWEAQLRATQAAIAETGQRIRALETQLAAVPSRVTTQVRTADNAMLLQNLRSTLLNLELKRTELSARFAPDYPTLREVETQIAQTRSAIAVAEKTPLRDETTDRDATYEWLRTELAKANTERTALQARATETANLIRVYREDSQRLEQKERDQQDLTRTAKSEEEKYSLYLRRSEEARISDELGRQRLSNVLVAEAPTVPSAPLPQRLLIVALGGLLAGPAGVLLAIAVERWGRSFRASDSARVPVRSTVVTALPERLG